jgi:hypothetical protein
MRSALALKIPYDVEKSIDFLQTKIVPLAVFFFFLMFIDRVAILRLHCEPKSSNMSPS